MPIEQHQSSLAPATTPGIRNVTVYYNPENLGDENIPQSLGEINVLPYQVCELFSPRSKEVNSKLKFFTTDSDTFDPNSVKVLHFTQEEGRKCTLYSHEPLASWSPDSRLTKI